MKKRKRAIILTCVAVLLAVCLIPRHALVNVIWQNLMSPAIKMNTQVWTGGTSWEHVSYSEVSDADYLNLYVPDSEKPMPLLVLVHGGGFITNDCESRQAQFMYRYFRQQGYACASINYRLSTEAPYPAALEDVKAAVRFLRANAGAYGYDADRIAIWGESAGGYLASMAAVTNDEEFAGVPFIGEEELAEPVSASVSVLLDYYGIIEFDKREEDFKEQGIPQWLLTISDLPLNRNLQGFDSVTDLWLRKSVKTCTEEELRQTNAGYYLEKNFDADSSLHVLTVHGDADLSVPYAQSERLAAAAVLALGQDKVTYRLIENYKHADDRFFTEEELASVKQYLDNIFGQN